MTEQEAARRWTQAWEEGGPRLEAIRREEIRSADNLAVLATLEGAFNQASPGLTELQRLLATLRR